MPTIDQNTIVVGVDGSPCSQEAVTWAALEAARTGRRLVLVCVWHWMSDAIGCVFPDRDAHDSRHAGWRLLDVAERQAKRCGAPATTYLVEGRAAEVLTELSGTAAMLVVGSHGRRGIGEAMMGSVSRECVHHARCPVVIIRQTVGTDCRAAETDRRSIPGPAAIS